MCGMGVDVYCEDVYVLSGWFTDGEHVSYLHRAF